MNMIGHQHVVQDTHPGESLLASHEREKTPGGQTPLERRAEDEEATDKPGNAVINSPTLSFDTWKTHNWSHSTQQKIKMYLKFEFYLNILTCPFRSVPSASFLCFGAGVIRVCVLGRIASASMMPRAGSNAAKRRESIDLSLVSELVPCFGTDAKGTGQIWPMPRDRSDVAFFVSLRSVLFGAGLMRDCVLGANRVGAAPMPRDRSKCGQTAGQHLTCPLFRNLGAFFRNVVLEPA